MNWNLEYIKWTLHCIKNATIIRGSIGTKKNPKTHVSSIDIIRAYEGRGPLERGKLYYYDNSEILETATTLADDIDVDLISIKR